MQPLDIAQQYFDAWNRHDADGIVSLFAESGTYTDPTTRGPLTGAAIGANASGLWAAFPDLRFEVDHVDASSSSVVAAQWTMLGTNFGSMFGLPPTNKEIVLAGADFVTVTNGRIDSVVGYFDSGVIPSQLGLQVLVQPQAVGPFRFGRSVGVRSQRDTQPGAFGVTILSAADEADQERITEISRQIAVEMLEMEGFLGWYGVVVGDRMATITAWEKPEQVAQLNRTGTHREAMGTFWADNGVAAGGWTSAWIPDRISPLWARCSACGKMVNSDRQDGVCECGTPLPAFGPRW